MRTFNLKRLHNSENGQAALDILIILTTLGAGALVLGLNSGVIGHSDALGQAGKAILFAAILILAHVVFLFSVSGLFTQSVEAEQSSSD